MIQSDCWNKLRLDWRTNRISSRFPSLELGGGHSQRQPMLQKLRLCCRAAEFLPGSRLLSWGEGTARDGQCCKNCVCAVEQHFGSAGNCTWWKWYWWGTSGWWLQRKWKKRDGSWRAPHSGSEEGEETTTNELWKSIKVQVIGVQQTQLVPVTTMWTARNSNLRNLRNSQKNDTTTSIHKNLSFVFSVVFTIWYQWCERCLLITESPKTPHHYRYQI